MGDMSISTTPTQHLNSPHPNPIASQTSAGSLTSHPAHKTLECTKGSIAAPFFMHLATRGEFYLKAHVEQLIELTQQFASFVHESPAFELNLEPECNIICFRLADSGSTDEESNALHVHES
jgi:glutamate/tyrosine decarboxylase-like PLP-dependent enzyme